MSRHFELMQRAQQDRVLARNDGAVHLPLFEAVPFPVVAVEDPIRPSLRPSLNLGPIAREEIVKLVDSTFLLVSAEAPPHSVVFASCERDDSSARITACTAGILAERIEGRICAVDGDLRSPVLHEQFGIGNEEGVLNALEQSSGIAGLAQHVAKNLWVICGGTKAQNGNDRHVTAESMRLLISELRATFDYILISAGAVASHSDAVLTGQAADGLVLLLEANKTRRETAEMCKQVLQTGAVRLLGAVLNNRDFPVPYRLYSKL